MTEEPRKKKNGSSFCNSNIRVDFDTAIHRDSDIAELYFDMN